VFDGCRVYTCVLKKSRFLTILIQHGEQRGVDDEGDFEIEYTAFK
jgi:hypothetical protein